MAPPPLGLYQVGGQGTLEADKRRAELGMRSYKLGVWTFLVAALWAAGTLTHALYLAYMDRLVITTAIAVLFGAKAVLFTAVEAFAIAMIRTAERQTMPMANHLQLVEAESAAKAKDGDAAHALDLIQKVVDLIKQGTEIADKAGK